MESLLEELTCPVCLDLYEQPVLLPCAHSLCKRCATEVFAEASRKPRQQPPGLGAAPKEQHVQCPSCRHEFQLPVLGVDGLRRNTTLQNIVDRYRESKNNTAAHKAVPCEMCDKEPPNDAVKTCLVCDNSYCETCLTTFHPMRGGLARHTLTDASTVTPKVLMCTEHSQEKVNMYCETDECLVCSLCKLVGKHKDHEVAAISDTFQQKKESIGGRVAGLIQQNAEVECFVDKIQETMTKAELNCSEIKGQVEAFAQTLVAAIMKRKSVLQTKVDVEKEQKLKTLGQQLGQWADTGTGISAAITEAEALLNEEDPITFLQACKSVEDRIDSFKFLEERKLNTTDQFIHNILGVSDLEQNVSLLDFMQAPESPRILRDNCRAGRDHITVCWAAGGNTPVDKYNIWYGKAGENRGLQYTDSSSSKSIKLQDLEENTDYLFVVEAVNAAGTAASKSVNITTTRGELQFKLDRREVAYPMVVAGDSMSVTCQPDVGAGRNRPSALPCYRPQPTICQRQPKDNPLVLGDVAIDKGRHYWEVNVEESFDFGLGVAYDSGLGEQCMIRSRATHGQRQSNQKRGRVYDSYCVEMGESVSKKFLPGVEVGPIRQDYRRGYPMSASQQNMFMARVNPEVPSRREGRGARGSFHGAQQNHLTIVGIVIDYDGGTIWYWDQNHSLITSQTQQFSRPVFPCLAVYDEGGSLSLV